MNIGTDIETAIAVLQSGNLVAIPTETVYGLAGNALNAFTVSRIFEVKDRPFFDPLIIHIPHFSSIAQYAEMPFPGDLRLLEKVWPGPLTYLAPKKNIIPDLVTAGSPLVALRVPNQPLTLQLLQKIDFPLAAPSANPFGYVSPTCASHVANQLGGKIEYILDGGECSIGIESTIVGRIEGKLVVFRLGGLSLEELEDLSMEKVAEVRRSSSKPDAPGMLSLHYAPHCKLYVLESPIPLAQNIDTEETAWLGFGTLPDMLSNKAKVLWLSKSGDTNEAARNVFRVLRQLDEQGFQRAHVLLLPEEGLGRAVNDRLIRAAAKRN